MKAASAAILALLLVGLVACDAKSTGPAGDAQRWLTHIDAGRYADAWSAGSAGLRSRTPKESWANEVIADRKPLGAVLSRKLLREKGGKTKPSSPEDDYYTVLFSTDFANRSAAVETVVFDREPAGWRVDAYLIR